MTRDIKTIDELGEAKILQYLTLTSDQKQTENTQHIIGGKEQTEFHGLAVCKYDNGAGVYLFYCDSDWNILTDTWHETTEDAQNQASFEFENLEGKWIAK
tara:strand:+ start:595 stop:894 length:300 start_codon:yes stop_codon:yes gene_type:complete